MEHGWVTTNWGGVKVANRVDQSAGELAKYHVNTSNILMNRFDKSLARQSGKTED